MKLLPLLSCEHASRHVPSRYAPLFAGAEDVLATHRAYDPGSLELARRLARALDAPLFAARATRLLADPNRSPGHPRLFSPWSSPLPSEERAALLELDWRPHRDAVEAEARSRARRGRALHLSIHSFTPVLDGLQRDVDVGFLYDPSRKLELAFARAWLDHLRLARPDLRLRRNAPYRGISDGLVTWLRRRLPEERYVALELEVSQRFPLGDGVQWRRLQRDLTDALRKALECGPVRSPR